MRRFALPLVSLVAFAAAISAGYSVVQLRRTRAEVASLKSSLAQEQESRRRQEDGLANLGLVVRARGVAWTGAGNAPLQARLVAAADAVSPGSPIRLLAEIHNASGEEQVVSGLLFHPSTIRVYCDGTPVRYLGPAAAMTPGGPWTLAPGGTMQELLVLTPNEYAELRQPGAFAAEWTYTSGYGSRRLTWAGRLPPVKTKWVVR